MLISEIGILRGLRVYIAHIILMSSTPLKQSTGHYISRSDGTIPSDFAPLAAINATQ